MHISNHILIIGTVWPEPNSSAAGSRMMQLIELFQAQKWEITFASAASELGSGQTVPMIKIGFVVLMKQLGFQTANGKYNHFYIHCNHKLFFLLILFLFCRRDKYQILFPLLFLLLLSLLLQLLLQIQH